MTHPNDIKAAETAVSETEWHNMKELVDRVALLTSEVERLRHALGVILPMAKGYAAANQVGRNNQIVLWAECIHARAMKGTCE